MKYTLLGIPPILDDLINISTGDLLANTEDEILSMDMDEIMNEETAPTHEGGNVV